MGMPPLDGETGNHSMTESDCRMPLPNVLRNEIAAAEVGGKRSLVAAVRYAMDQAASAQAYRAHTPTGFHEPTHFIPMDTTRSVVACLSGDNLTTLFDANGKLRRTPHSAPSTDELKMDAVVIANSRVARAGAGVIIMPEASKPRPVGRNGAVVLESVPGFVRHVDAATWSIVDVDSLAEIPQSPSPIASVRIDWSQATAKAVRFEVPRAERMTYADQDQLCGQIVAGITLGLARAADALLLDAIAATNPQPFNLASVAAQDLAFDDIRALVGTDGAGANVGPDGALRAAGIAAQLTADASGTLVGAWDRCAVAIRDDVTINFQRTGHAGAMTVTAWMSMLALIPAPQKFWEVA